MFTKQHYKIIAEIIKSEYTRFDNTGENDYEGKHAIICIVGKLAHRFSVDNPLFNRDNFIKACYED